MRSLTRSIICLFLLGSAVFSQQKQWTEWDKKEVEKMLNSSAWGQTQNETFAEQLTAQIGTRDPNQAFIYNYRIRLFSARPIREAFARQVLLADPRLRPEQLKSFIDGDYSESIVVAVAFDGTDRRVTAPVEKVLTTATTESLSKKAYLERKDGKRIWLVEYAPPSADGSGAKFVFDRLLDGKPFFGGAEDTLRFVAELDGVADINWKFKLSEMTYKGKIEY